MGVDSLLCFVLARALCLSRGTSVGGGAAAWGPLRSMGCWGPRDGAGLSRTALSNSEAAPIGDAVPTVIVTVLGCFCAPSFSGDWGQVLLKHAGSSTSLPANALLVPRCTVLEPRPRRGFVDMGLAGGGTDRKLDEGFGDRGFAGGGTDRKLDAPLCTESCDASRWTGSCDAGEEDGFRRTDKLAGEWLAGKGSDFTDRPLSVSGRERRARRRAVRSDCAPAVLCLTTSGPGTQSAVGSSSPVTLMPQAERSRLSPRVADGGPLGVRPCCGCCDLGVELRRALGGASPGEPRGTAPGDEPSTR